MRRTPPPNPFRHRQEATAAQQRATQRHTPGYVRARPAQLEQPSVAVAGACDPSLCPCGFRWPATTRAMHTAELHAEHRTMHLAAYPSADALTRRSLDRLVDMATRREAVCYARREAVCYACDDAPVGTCDRRAEGGTLEHACARHEREPRFT